MIWKLQLNTRTKISLICVLSLGYFASAAAIVKAVQQFHVLEDPDWTVNDSFNIWNFIELTVGIVAASLPALKPLFNWFLDTARAFTSATRTKNNGYNNYHKGASSLGYQKQTEDSSIGLHSLATKTDSPRDPYSVDVLHPHEKEWDMEIAKKSDDSILPQQGRPTGQGIVMTREIHVV